MHKTKYYVIMIIVGLINVIMLGGSSVPIEYMTSNAIGFIKRPIINFTHNAQNSSPCMALLLEAAQKGEIPGTLVDSDDNGSDCAVYYDLKDENQKFIERSSLFLSTTGDFNEPCGISENGISCKQTTFHGYPAAYFTFFGTDIGYTLAWNMPKGKDHYRLGVHVGFSGKTPAQYAEALWSIAEDRLPLMEDNTIQPKSTPENNPGVVVVPNGETAPKDSVVETGSFDETWQSPQAKAVRSPLLPIVGGVIGAGLAWLLAQGSSQAASTAMARAAQVYTSSQTVPPVLTKTPPALVTEPPTLVTTPPEFFSGPTPVETEAPPPVVTLTNPYELGFNLVKDTIGATGNLMGIYEKFLTDPNSLKTVNLIRDAVNTLDQTPGAEATAAYVSTIAKTNEIAKAGKSNNVLGVLGKGLDIVEAGVKAAKICEERGYHGMDAAMRTYAEVGKKGIVWSLTKNPVVALADAAVGGATSMLFGAANKMDIGTAVDKADYAWDNVTRHASNQWNRSFETAANDAQIDDVRTLTQRIAQQVREGKLSKQEGAQRLRKVLDKINQESPLL
jgi:hypothetical protein